MKRKSFSFFFFLVVQRETETLVVNAKGEQSKSTIKLTRGSIMDVDFIGMGKSEAEKSSTRTYIDRDNKFSELLPLLLHLLLLLLSVIPKLGLGDSHVWRRSPIWVEGRCGSFEDLSSAGWYHPQKWFHCHQRQGLQGLFFYLLINHRFSVLFTTLWDLNFWVRLNFQLSFRLNAWFLWSLGFSCFFLRCLWQEFVL